MNMLTFCRILQDGKINYDEFCAMMRSGNQQQGKLFWREQLYYNVGFLSPAKSCWKEL